MVTARNADELYVAEERCGAAIPGEVSETKKLTDEKSGLKCRLPSLKALLLSAQELISKGVAVKDMDK
ncbi:hypothetical protein HPB47_019549, partial [Ixodes persulcatus]